MAYVTRTVEIEMIPFHQKLARKNREQLAMDRKLGRHDMAIGQAAAIARNELQELSCRIRLMIDDVARACR